MRNLSLVKSCKVEKQDTEVVFEDGMDLEKNHVAKPEGEMELE